MLSISEVDLGLIDELQDPTLRRQFFREAAQEAIASQIRYMREIRNMRQIDLARASGMKQSAISRLEKADYSSWNFNTLMRLGDALDARVKVVIEPAEDVIRELQNERISLMAVTKSSYEQYQDQPIGLGAIQQNAPAQHQGMRAA